MTKGEKTPGFAGKANNCEYSVRKPLTFVLEFRATGGGSLPSHALAMALNLHHKRRTLLPALAATAFLVTAPGGATADSGGVGTHGSDAPHGTKAKLLKDGTAVPPRGAPKKVVKIIRAANKIEDKPYRYGGGHASWKSKGYDCSGAISYALRAGGLVKSPLNSTGFMSWGKRGRGSWVTVYANPGHAYAVIAGLRWDTSMTPGNGPGWSEEMRSAKGYKKRTKAV